MGAVLPNIDALVGMGIDPKTGLPIKASGSTGVPDAGRLKGSIKTQLRILDEQDSVNCFTWYNLPSGLDGQLLERILYYNGQGVFFYLPTIGQFYFLPYNLNGQIDCYGRFKSITPLPFRGGVTTEKEGKQKAFIQGLSLDPIYSIPFEITEAIFTNGCVILKDYTEQSGELIIPRQQLMDPLLDAMSEAIPMGRTALIANSGVRGVRVVDEDSKAEVRQASRAITLASLTGESLIPMIGKVDFQDLTAGKALNSEEYMLYLQALDNYRLSLHGLSNGGLFQKKSHMLEAEQDMNAGRAKLALQDRLTKRQKFCDFVNAVWGLGIWCDVSESAIGLDTNGDGMVADKQDQSGSMPGTQPEMMGGESYEQD